MRQPQLRVDQYVTAILEEAEIESERATVRERRAGERVSTTNPCQPNSTVPAEASCRILLIKRLKPQVVVIESLCHGIGQTPDATGECDQLLGTGADVLADLDRRAVVSEPSMGKPDADEG